MTTNDAAEFPRLRFGLLLFLAGMLGVAVITVTVVPQFVQASSLSAPLCLILLASLGQSALILALAVWSGVSLAPKVGLRAPAFEAAVSTGSVTAALRPQLLPGLVGGLLGGLGLHAIGGYAAPAALANVEQRFAVPILARVLYGGITEELLLRWGVMTALVWMAWRFLQRREGTPRVVHIWVAIVVSAFLFGAGHLPGAAAQVGQLTTAVVLFVLGANTAFGVLFGYLFWRHGLEAAMIAHLLAHVVSHVVGLATA